MFNPSLQKALRRYHDLTTTRLGERVGLSHNQIVRYEKGLSTPPDEAVEALAVVLRVAPKFFFAPHGDVVNEWECNFRAPKGATERAREKLAAGATLFAMIVHNLNRVVPFYPLNLPVIKAVTLADVDEGARVARHRWGLSLEGPIDNVSAVAERAGVVITRMPIDETSMIDGFSRYGDVSLIVVSDAKGSPTRWRFSVAHELAHGVLGHGTRGQSMSHEAKEEQANRFASAFLMPAESFAQDFSVAGSTIDGLLELKDHWGCSISAMTFRAHQLGLINVAEYRDRFRTLSRRGWRIQEPQEPEAEQPELFRVAFQAFQLKSGKSFAAFADDLHVSSKILEEVSGLKESATTSESDSNMMSFEAFRLKRHVQ